MGRILRETFQTIKDMEHKLAALALVEVKCKLARLNEQLLHIRAGLRSLATRSSTDGKQPLRLQML
jgi:hypothetical protein